MDDIREQMDLANEISEAISQPVGFGAEFDEEELNAELEELEQESLDEQLLEGKGRVEVSLPSVPSAIPGKLSAGLHRSFFADSFHPSQPLHNHRDRPRWRKRTTKMRSCGSSRNPWRCEEGEEEMRALSQGITL